MKIAVSVDENGMVSGHLGRNKIFLIFDANESKVEFIDKRITDGRHENHIIEDIKDCTYVLSAQIGEGMVKNLANMGITAVVETEITNPRKAVKKMI